MQNIKVYKLKAYDFWSNPQCEETNGNSKKWPVQHKQCFLKKCSCGYSAVDILCQNWGSIFPGNFDIKFTHAVVFTRESV